MTQEQWKIACGLNGEPIPQFVTAEHCDPHGPWEDLTGGYLVTMTFHRTKQEMDVLIHPDYFTLRPSKTYPNPEAARILRQPGESVNDLLTVLAMEFSDIFSGKAERLNRVVVTRYGRLILKVKNKKEPKP